MPRLIGLPALVFVTGCAAHAGPSIARYEAGDYAGAARVADDGLAQHPGDNSLWAMRVRSALALGDADGVAKAYAGYVAHRGDDDHELLRDLATATLGQALASPSTRLKIEAIEAVQAIEIQALADRVAERLGDDDDRVAASAAIAILRGGYAQAPQVADDMLRSENPEARRIALDGLARKLRKLVVAELERAGADPDARVRATALRWLGTIKDTGAVELCTKRLHDHDEAVRAASATALARIGNGNLESLGKVALKDHALAVRIAGVELIAAAGRIDELTELANDPEPLVAIQAAIAAKQPALAGPALDRAQAAAEWTTRAGAANLLVQAIGKTAALPRARQLAGDREVAVRLAAARVLAHAGDPAGAQAVFSAALVDADHAIQAAADLGALDDAAGIAALSGFVRDPKRTADQRAEAASAHRTAHHVTPGLVAALADPSGVVRVAAAATLGMLAK